MADPVKIFLSYAHVDADGVSRIYQRLQEKGYQPWLDREDILGGEEWEPAIRSGIRQADFFLLCMSPQSITRRGVLQKEIKTALDVAEEKLETDIFLIPVWIQAGTPLPKEEMPERLARLQWINLSEQNGWQKLTRSIEQQLKRVKRDAPASPTPTTADAVSSDDPVTVVDAESLVARVRDSVQAGDAAAVEAAGAAVVDALAHRSHGFTLHHGARVANLLWRKHLVTIVRPVSDAFIRAGVDVSSVRRVYADALLAERWLIAALDVISKAEESASGDPTEQALVAEVRGRIQTAMYLHVAHSAPRDAADHLWWAVEAYADVYASDPRRHLLHGARAAALVLRADRAGISRPSSVQPDDIAVRIRNEIRDSEESRRPIELGDCEAAIHAALATRSHDEAAAWLQRYVTHAQVDVAYLRTLHEQLSEIWQLEPDAMPGSELIPVVRLKILSSTLLPVSAPTSPLETAAVKPLYEKVFSRDLTRSMRWYERGLTCAQRVVRIETPSGSPLASGFLLSGRDLDASFPDEPLLLTNAYVVTDDPNVKEGYAFSVPGPQDVRARFPGDSSVHELEVVWSSLEAATTILRFPSPIDRDWTLKLAPRFPLRGTKTYIIGYPGGGDIRYSLDDNLILDCDERVLHYRTPTEGGSSGSPVFNESWEVIAMHHAGGDLMPRLHGAPGTYEANEGIRLDFIRKVIASGAAARAYAR